MKSFSCYFILLSLLFVAGCDNDKYDLNSSDIKSKSEVKINQSIDSNKLPPGSKIEEASIPKGGPMPDGTTSDKDTKIRRFSTEVPDGSTISNPPAKK